MTNNTYKADVFRFTLEKENNSQTAFYRHVEGLSEIINLKINNIISWDWIDIKLTKEELKGLADFIYENIKN